LTVRPARLADKRAPSPRYFGCSGGAATDVAVRVLEDRVVAHPGIEGVYCIHPTGLQLGARRRDVVDVKGDRWMGLELTADRRGVEDLQRQIPGLELGPRHAPVSLDALQPKRYAVELLGGFEVLRP
jgi:hypothetical protein